MPQISALVATLKSELRSQGKTYKDVALALDLSEASVKRLFAEKSFSLQRLEAVCHMLGLEISDLSQKMLSQQGRIEQLTEEQELQIVSDLSLVLITVSVLNGFTFDDIIARYTLKETECIRLLATLDKLKLIELLPNNRIKLLVAHNFSWRVHGPIQQFFRKRVEQEYFNSSFSKDGEELIVINGLVSKAGNHDFQKKMQRLSREFTEQVRTDASLPLDERIGYSIVLAIRDWRFSFFDEYRRQ